MDAERQDAEMSEERALIELASEIANRYDPMSLKEAIKFVRVIHQAGYEAALKKAREEAEAEVKRLREDELILLQQASDRENWKADAEAAEAQLAEKDRQIKNLEERVDVYQGALREERQWAIKLKTELAQNTANSLQIESAIKLALEKCSFPVGAMKAKAALESARQALAEKGSEDGRGR